MSVLDMEQSGAYALGSRGRLYSNRVGSSGISDTYILPEGGDLRAVGAKITLTSGVTGSIVQTQEGTVGAEEIQTLTITHAADNSGAILVTLNGVSVAVEVAAGDSINAVAAKVRATPVTGWVISGTNADIVYTADAVGVRGGTYSVVVSGTGAIEFSFSSRAEIEAGTGVFVAWNNSDVISLAVNAWRLAVTAGFAIAEVAARVVI